MPAKWHDLKIGNEWFANISESVLGANAAAIENCFRNDQKGYTRFPGLKSFCSLAGAAPTYIDEFRGDLIAVSNGRTWRIDSNGNAQEVTGTHVSGSYRVIFSETPDEKLMAAGGAIVKFDGVTTSTLSPDAPQNTTHIGYLYGYTVASEFATGLFFHSAAGDSKDWQGSDVFAADSDPDNVIALFVTPFRELMVAGTKSLEQYERLTTGDVPFFRRWDIGTGVAAPYLMTFADNALWFLNQDREFVRASAQISTPVSDPIGKLVAGIEDLSDAWATWLYIAGQKYVLAQFPQADTQYGTKGLTLLWDYRQKLWLQLFGWDDVKKVPTRWPGWSYLQLWGRHFVGGNGEVFELDTATYENAGQPQLVLFRSGHFDNFGECRIDNIRIRVKRGVGGYVQRQPRIRLRVRRDNKSITRWVERTLGHAGENEQFVEFGGMGCCHMFQLEVEMTDAADFDLVMMQAQVTPLGE